MTGDLPKVIVLGAGGQLGRELIASAPAGVECLAYTRAQLDLTDSEAVSQVLREQGTQAVINAAAYTAVDLAESEPEQAAAGNIYGPSVLAAACAQLDCRLIHVSTDFVFDGSASEPYAPDSKTSPLGVYGQTKRDGEAAVLAALPDATIVRTGWVYSAYGSNFVKTMLRLMSERDSLSVVADQVGTPTWAAGLAKALWAFAARPDLSGIYHWSDAGVCSWYDFAVAICEEGEQRGLLKRAVPISPIAASAYPTPARRPAYSVLDKSATWADLEIEGTHWRVQMRAMLEELQESENV
ncbi:MAG: dTDP-4-dehydrorhamnose reductase [Halioglobus sp.]